jgi:hypothetical protein
MPLLQQCLKKYEKPSVYTLTLAISVLDTMQVHLELRISSRIVEKICEGTKRIIMARRKTIYTPPPPSLKSRDSVSLGIA